MSSPRKRLSRGARVLVAIGLSASLTSILALSLFKGTANAQPTGSAGSGAPVGSGTPTPTPTTGSATGSAGSGSAVLEAGSGSAAAGSGSAVDTGSGSAGSGSAAAPVAPVAGKPPATKITVVPCGKTPSKVIVKAGDGAREYGFSLAITDPKRDPALHPNDVEVNDIIEFQLGGAVNVIPDAASDPNLEAPAGKTTCVSVNGEGVFGFHSSTNIRGKFIAKPWYTRLAERKVEDDNGGTFWMPRAVNKAADGSDQMFYAVFALSAFFFIAIAVAVIYLVVKYRHRPGHKAEKSATHNDALEITWTIIPTIICVFLFWYGWRSYIHVVTPPTAAVEISVTAQRWTWEFRHSNGVKDVDLHVPVGKPVRLVMTSTDVLHSFYAPVLRVKQDIIPRRYTYAWFQATKPGTYRLKCAEYCGTNHSQMGINDEGRRAVVVVHEPGKYERYLADKQALESNMAPEALGRMLFEKKGCNGCHTIDGSAKIGPSFYKDFGTMVPLASGGTVKMDENYIRESLLAPQAKARPNYPASMPSFEGSLKEAEIEGIIAFIKSLK